MIRSTKKLTLDEVLASFNLKHKGYYSYPRFVYKNNRTKSVITCPVHGDFYQVPKSHMKGRGCHICGGTVKLTQEQVINNMSTKHQNRYGYGDFIYKNTRTKGVISCNIHGNFLMAYGDHMNGHGCKQCGVLSSIQSRQYTTEEIVKAFIEKHKGLYDYSKFEYVTAHTPGIIICRIHGEFLQNSNNHLGGAGCPHCHNAAKKSTQDEVLKAFHLKHDGKYGYDKVIYESTGSKVTITCPKHGDFRQTPASHLRGAGCPGCKESRGEKAIASILGSLNLNFERQKSFDGCMYVIKLRFDFYLPEHNLVIEFDGKQHFEPVAFWGGLAAFNESQRRDTIKSEFCVKNNIRLLRIPYTKLANATELITETINN